MTDVPVNPDVLIWAREERGMTGEQAAEALGVPVEQLARYEAGDDRPSVSFLRQMAKAYKIAFASLLMPDPLPPSSRLRLKDFRVEQGRAPDLTRDTLLAIDMINEAIEAFVDLRDLAPQLLGAPPLPRLTRSQRAETAAKAERQRLGITMFEQIAWESPAVAFRAWRAAIERQGIFIYLVKMGVNDCRGFSV